MIPLEKRHGHRGVAHLRVAVMEVLYSAKKNRECIGGAEISRRAGIFREPGYATKQGNDQIVWGILNSLAKDNLITKCTQKNNRLGWKLTKAAFAQRARKSQRLPIGEVTRESLRLTGSNSGVFAPVVWRSSRSVQTSTISGQGPKAVWTPRKTSSCYALTAIGDVAQNHLRNLLLNGWLRATNGLTMCHE